MPYIHLRLAEFSTASNASNVNYHAKSRPVMFGLANSALATVVGTDQGGLPSPI